MPLGTAIIVVFLLYLIDKHDLWRALLKGARCWGRRLFYGISLGLLGLATLAGIALCVWLGWQKVDSYITKQHTAAISACIDRNVGHNVSIYGLRTACENNFAFQGIPTISRVVLADIDGDATLAENARVQHQSNTVALWAVIIGFGILGLFLFWRTRGRKLKVKTEESR